MKKVTDLSRREQSVLVNLGFHIIDLRKDKGYSQLQLAYKANISKNYLSDLENGRRNPSILVLQRIADALDCDLSVLMETVSPEKEKPKGPTLYDQYLS